MKITAYYIANEKIISKNIQQICFLLIQFIPQRNVIFEKLNSEEKKDELLRIKCQF